MKDSSQQLTDCRTYELNGITYVPSYFDVGIYAGPGGQRISQSELKHLKAKPTVTQLWPREWTKNQKLQEKGKAE